MLFSGFGPLLNVSNVTQCHVGKVTPGVRRVGNWQHEPCFQSNAIKGTDGPIASGQTSFVFTFVRDPAKTALSAYLELRFRARYRSRGKEAFQELFDNENGDKSCPRTVDDIGRGGGDDATSQFVAYLEALERGSTPLGLALGRDAYHAWPQALKIDRLAAHSPSSREPHSSASSGPPQRGNRMRAARRKRRGEYGIELKEDDDRPMLRRYDAIGKLETLDRDLGAVRLLMENSEAQDTDEGYEKEGEQAESERMGSLVSHHHSHAKSTCANVNLNDPRVAQKICRLYTVDYACFEYDIPDPCRGLGNIEMKKDLTVR